MDPQHPPRRKKTNRRSTMNDVELELFNKGGMMDMIGAFSSVQEQKYNDAVKRNEDSPGVRMNCAKSVQTARAKFETQKRHRKNCEQGIKEAEDKMWKLLYSTAPSIMSDWCRHTFAMEQHKKMEARALSVLQGDNARSLIDVFAFMDPKVVDFSSDSWTRLTLTNKAMKEMVLSMTKKMV